MFWRSASSAILSVVLLNCAPAQDIEIKENKENKASNIKDQSSYTLGFSIGSQFAADGLGDVITAEDFLKGFVAALAGKESELSSEQMQTAMQNLQKMAMEMQKTKFDQNLTKANEFLAANKKKDGVVALESGLQYKVLKAGSGKQPSRESSVTVHYEGKLLDGTIFDSSIKRGQPATFPVGGVIAGWTEALQRMKVGDKWQLFIPPNLAYGTSGSPPKIEPNSCLIFEVELLEVN